MSKTLILCSSMPEAQAYQRHARRRGEATIATSSVRHDETAALYDAWEWLPDIYDRTFQEALADVISRHDVARIYCPHDIVRQRLAEWKDAGQLAVPLVGNASIAEQAEATGRLLAEAESAGQWIARITGGEALPAFRIAAILRQAELTYGQSAPAKLIAMMAAFAQMPQGDVVEIGSFWGKTAVALAMLAREYRTGAVLCVDPWRLDAALQKDSPAIVRQSVMDLDWNTVFDGFVIHAAAVCEPGRFNYLRMPSVEAEALYRKNKTVSSPEFGVTDYRGKIAFIHIDGNHDYASVRLDYEKWRPYMLPGGWMALDDYVWRHGDGPKRLGNEILKSESENIQRSFAAGEALFLQLN